ncbi:MAG: hypothetical protein IJY78_04845, partial [Bacteroidaceae bacterium]|nr:hypothetical protein [Bacteroidaceae bacterium]
YGEGTLSLTGASEGKINVHEGTVMFNNTSVATTTGAVTVNDGAMIAGAGKVNSVTVNKGGIIGASKSTVNIGKLTVLGNLTVKSGGIIRVRVRGTNARHDEFVVSGQVNLTSPVFRMEHLTGEFSEGDEIEVFTGNGKISIAGEPQFVPSVPKPGYLWDCSTLESDGVIRVVPDPVGIGGIETDENTDSEVYDLTGRKLNKVGSKGIYIVNGKKVIVR